MGGRSYLHELDPLTPDDVREFDAEAFAGFPCGPGAPGPCARGDELGPDDAEVGNRELGVLECSLRWALLLELPVTLDVDGGAVGPKLRHHPVVLLSQIHALAAQRALGFPPVL